VFPGIDYKTYYFTSKLFPELISVFPLIQCFLWFFPAPLLPSAGYLFNTNIIMILITMW